MSRMPQLVLLMSVLHFSSLAVFGGSDSFLISSRIFEFFSEGFMGLERRINGNFQFWANQPFKRCNKSVK